jgi:hypothetical protein
MPENLAPVVFLASLAPTLRESLRDLAPAMFF